MKKPQKRLGIEKWTWDQKQKVKHWLFENFGEGGTGLDDEPNRWGEHYDYADDTPAGEDDSEESDDEYSYDDSDSEDDVPADEDSEEDDEDGTDEDGTDDYVLENLYMDQDVYFLYKLKFS
jgi:hypothetical protein